MLLENNIAPCPSLPPRQLVLVEPSYSSTVTQCRRKKVLPRNLRRSQLWKCRNRERSGRRKYRDQMNREHRTLCPISLCRFHFQYRWSTL
uniref:Uncharacterized protein n=1 Tax=Romanomermis culicivorax TaxID=13658 RepID=A0A915L8I8_ROMCU